MNLLTFLAIMGSPRSKNVRYGAHMDILVRKNGSDPDVELYFENQALVLQGCPKKCSLEKWLVLLTENYLQIGRVYVNTELVFSLVKVVLIK